MKAKIIEENTFYRCTTNSTVHNGDSKVHRTPNELKRSQMIEKDQQVGPIIALLRAQNCNKKQTNNCKGDDCAFIVLWVM